MKVTFAAAMLAATALAANLPIVDENDFVEGWFANKIDHFNYQSTKTYQQRYWSNDVYCAG